MCWKKNGSTYLCLLLMLFMIKDALEAFEKLVILYCIFLPYFMDKHVSQPGISRIKDHEIFRKMTENYCLILEEKCIHK